MYISKDQITSAYLRNNIVLKLDYVDYIGTFFAPFSHHFQHGAISSPTRTVYLKERSTTHIHDRSSLLITLLLLNFRCEL